MKALWVLAISVFFWNMENFFDWRSDGSGYDVAFTPSGERHWTYRRFRKKCADAAKALLWCAQETGGLPDAVGFAELENRFVLRCLLKYTILEKLDYETVHFESPDRRGIDVGLIYRKSRLRLLAARPVKVEASRGADTLRTRDILVGDFVTAEGDTITLAVNHHPSKFGGGDSDWRRKAALEALAAVADSVRRAGGRLIAMGDFNDTPDRHVYAEFCEQLGLKNLALPLAKQGKGTIRYEGRWELIDHFYVPEGASAEMKIMKVPFLMTRDNVHSGEKPMRTYTGPRYAGGVSDHLPIALRFEF
ncbi:MAG: hypothetical protein SPL35_07365 [Bacteroidales bacterium]|nr:hypothetical protein [Bacteroidales bacterium]